MKSKSQTWWLVPKILALGRLRQEVYWLVLCVNLTEVRVIEEEGDSVEEMPP